MALLAEVMIFPLDILVEVIMHLALVGEIQMMPLLAEVEHIYCSSYCVGDMLLYLTYYIMNLMLYMFISIYIPYFSY